MKKQHCQGHSLLAPKQSLHKTRFKRMRVHILNASTSVRSLLNEWLRLKRAKLCRHASIMRDHWIDMNLIIHQQVRLQVRPNKSRRRKP